MDETAREIIHRINSKWLDKREEPPTSLVFSFFSQSQGLFKRLEGIEYHVNFPRVVLEFDFEDPLDLIGSLGCSTTRNFSGEILYSGRKKQQRILKTLDELSNYYSDLGVRVIRHSVK